MDAQPLTESLRETLALFEEAGVPLTTAEVTERLDLGRRAVYARLRRLVEQDRLETKKVGASARVWWQPRATTEDSRDVARPDEHERESRSDRDDTGRDDHERALARYETLFEESKDVNVVVGTDGRFQHVTQSAANVFGYDAETLVGEVGFEYIHPDDRATAMEEFSKMIETPGYEPKIEFRFEHSDGSWIVVEALGRNLLDDPDIGGLVVYTRDVTERTERERELRDRVRQQEVVTDLGRRALETRDVDALMAEAAELVADTLETEPV